ncbi:hypothetical protein VP01_7778g1, partial [Puccinia sorghi]
LFVVFYLFWLFSSEIKIIKLEPYFTRTTSCSLVLSCPPKKPRTIFGQTGTHWHKVKKIWQYLKDTSDLKLTLEIKNPNELLQIFSDASWGDDPQDRTSQSSYLCLLFCALISWNSSKQLTVNVVLVLLPKRKLTLPKNLVSCCVALLAASEDYKINLPKLMTTLVIIPDSIYKKKKKKSNLTKNQFSF